MSRPGDVIIARVQQMQPRKPLAEKCALSSERLRPLPLVNHFITRLGHIELLDQYVPTADRRCVVPHATALRVLLRSVPRSTSSPLPQAFRGRRRADGHNAEGRHPQEDTL